MIRPRPMGTDSIKTWFTAGEVVRRIGEDTYRIKVGHRQFLERHESQLCVREPDLRGQHVSLDYAAHEADSDDDYAEQDDYTVEKILAQRPNASGPEAWSSRFVGEAMGRPGTPGNPSPRSCRGLIPPLWITSASTRPSSMLRTWQHSPGRLQPEAPDHRPGLSPVSIAGLSSVISESTLHDIAEYINAYGAGLCPSWMVSSGLDAFGKHCP